jgi:NhaP-type Na+/H+ or K+/H+ antiporter
MYLEMSNKQTDLNRFHTSPQSSWCVGLLAMWLWYGEFDWIGIIGILIYGLLLVYTLLRLVESFMTKNKTIKYLNYKITYHLVFAIYCICETIYYASILIEGQ